MKIAWMAAQGQGNDVIQLVVAFIGIEIHSLLAEKALFDAIGKARAGAHRLGVAAAADGLTLRCRCHVRIEQGVGDRLGAGAGQAQREAGKGFEHEAY